MVLPDKRQTAIPSSRQRNTSSMLCVPQRTYCKGNIFVYSCLPFLQYVNKNMVGWKTQIWPTGVWEVAK